MAYTNNSVTAPVYSLIEMLRLYVPSIQKRVYPPGTRIDAQMPRINVAHLSPQEHRIGIGEGFGSYKGLWYLYQFRVTITDNDPAQIDKVASEVQYAIWKHREYVPASPNDTYGELFMMEVNGGSGTDWNTGMGVYQRTINVNGTWLSKSTENW